MRCLAMCFVGESIFCVLLLCGSYAFFVGLGFSPFKVYLGLGLFVHKVFVACRVSVMHV